MSFIKCAAFENANTEIDMMKGIFEIFNGIEVSVNLTHNLMDKATNNDCSSPINLRKISPNVSLLINPFGGHQVEHQTSSENE